MKIINSVFEKSSKTIGQCPNKNLPEFAFVGRSNVGKSSLINSLLNNKSIAKLSSKPGKTLLINHFRINDKLFMVDLPGYGYATVIPMDSPVTGRPSSIPLSGNPKSDVKKSKQRASCKPWPQVYWRWRKIKHWARASKKC